MEMELFLREILIETRSYHRRGNNRHRLNFVEELKNDGQEEVVCEECEEPAAVGPTFKCRVCRYLCHVSCFDSTSTLYIHFRRRHDQLMFTEEMKNDVNDQGCLHGVPGENRGSRIQMLSAFECNFQLHKSCAQLRHKMDHPSHPNHILILERPDDSSGNCNTCSNWCNTCLFYRCNECNFNLDIICATRMQIIHTNDCQHSFVPFFKKINFTCEVCGREGTNFASLCTICRLLIHSKCAGFQRTIRISRHHHALTLVSSLHHQVKDFNHLFCKLCGYKIKTEYAALCCHECGFVAHLYCADPHRVSDSRAEYYSLPQKSVNVMKINPGELQHFSHEHNLILSHEEIMQDKLCDGCIHFIISAPFYNCTQRNFVLHTKCAQLPRNKKHILHRHALTLLQHAPYKGGVFVCNACGHSRHGFTYRCDSSEYDLDVQCCSILETLKHEGHQHSLLLAIISNKSCNACDHGYKHRKDHVVFVCTICDFALGFECATLPLKAKHRYDEHPLALTYVAEDKSEKYYCLICEEEMDPKHWFYYCAKCDFLAHRQCVIEKYPYIKFGSTYEDKNHRHPITFVRKIGSSPPCDACGKTFDGMALECTQCKFNVHGMNSECMQKISTKVLHP